MGWGCGAERWGRAGWEGGVAASGGGGRARPPRCCSATRPPPPAPLPVKHGWEYEVEEPNQRSRARPKRYVGYGDNYSVKRKGLPVGGLRSELAGKK